MRENPDYGKHIKVKLIKRRHGTLLNYWQQRKIIVVDCFIAKINVDHYGLRNHEATYIKLEKKQNMRSEYN